MKTNTSFSWELFEQSPVIGIIRGRPESEIMKIAESYSKAGLYTLEITANTQHAGFIINKLRDRFPELCIGAGTVCSMDDYQKMIDAGAQYIVTPILNKEVIQRSVAGKTPIFPGAFSPSEIYTAWNLGATAVKVFPATHLGPQYIKDVLAPLQDIRLLPTGGVTKDNMASYFNAGAVGVGLGSMLFDKNLILRKDYNALTQHFIQIKELVAESF